MASRWRENGIVVTALAFAAAALLAIAESLVDNRTQSPIVIAIDGAAEDDDEGEDQSFDNRAQDAALASTVPLYGSLDELDERARQALAEPQPRADLLHELARQARGFRAYTLAEALLARCLELAPQRVDSQFLLARTRSDLGRVDQAIDLYEAVLVLSPNHQKATYNLGVLSRRAGELLRAETLEARCANFQWSAQGKGVASTALTRRGWTLEDAARSLEAVARPDSARHWLDLGQAHQLGRLEPLSSPRKIALNHVWPMPTSRWARCSRAWRSRECLAHFIRG
jgi:tetratricopeptide (TPR) repeat protein